MIRGPVRRDVGADDPCGFLDWAAVDGRIALDPDDMRVVDDRDSRWETVVDPRPRIFICGPYTGHEDDADARFGSAQRRLEGYGYRVVNPIELCRGMDQTNWDACMRMTITALLSCTGVALLDGWESSRGAVVEVEVARGLGMPVGTVPGWTWECSVPGQ